MITMKNRPGTRELYVSDISFQAEEEDLRKLFVLFGTVTSIHMVKYLKSGRFKGSAFVRMATPAQARDVLNSLDGTYLVDRCIKITGGTTETGREPCHAAACRSNRTHSTPTPIGLENTVRPLAEVSRRYR